jgi:hypothetical protein
VTTCTRHPHAGHHLNWSTELVIPSALRPSLPHERMPLALSFRQCRHEPNSCLSLRTSIVTMSELCHSHAPKSATGRVQSVPPCTASMVAARRLKVTHCLDCHTSRHGHPPFMHCVCGTEATVRACLCTTQPFTACIRGRVPDLLHLSCHECSRTRAESTQQHGDTQQRTWSYHHRYIPQYSCSSLPLSLLVPAQAESNSNRA